MADTAGWQTMCRERALTQAMLSRSASPSKALYKSPQGECLPISSQGLGELKNKNILSPPLITLEEQQVENVIQKPIEGSQVQAHLGDTQPSGNQNY